MQPLEGVTSTSDALPSWATVLRGKPFPAGAAWPGQPCGLARHFSTSVSPYRTHLKFTVHTLGLCHGLSFDFLAVTLLCHLKVNSDLKPLHSCLGKKILYSVTNAFWSNSKCCDVPRGYHFVMFYLSHCSGFGCLLETMRGGEGSGGNWHSPRELVLGGEELLETGLSSGS